MLAGWNSGTIVVPLSTKFSNDELNFNLKKFNISALITDSLNIVKNTKNIKPNPSNTKLIFLQNNFDNFDNLYPKNSNKFKFLYSLNFNNNQRLDLFKNSAPKNALLLRTSGTTGYSKGVLFTNTALSQQINSIIKCWNLSKNDHFLHSLPLHHIHGFVNVLIYQYLSMFKQKCLNKLYK